MKTIALLITIPDNIDTNSLIKNIENQNKSIHIIEADENILSPDKRVLICPLHEQCTCMDTFNNLHGNFKNLGIHELDGISLEEIEQIVSFTSKNTSTQIKFITGKSKTTSKNLGFYESNLPHSLFCRISRFNIINIHMMSRYYNIEGGYIIMKDKSRLKVTDTYRQAFLKLIGTLS